MKKIYNKAMTKDQNNTRRRERYAQNKEKRRSESREYHRSHPEMNKRVWDNHMFGGNRQLALERDNWECQECGMSQEQHMILFNRSLTVDHIDGNGRNSEIQNNDLDNLKTLCLRCHGRKDNLMDMKKRWGELLEQDDSEWKFPKIRTIINEKKKILGTLEKAKQELADELEVCFYTIDHKYYDRKEGFLTRVQSRRNSKPMRNIKKGDKKDE